MGYTHYWRRIPVLAPELFARVLTDAKHVLVALAAAGLVLCGPNGRGTPKLTRSCIAFNGQEQCGHEQRALGITWPARVARGISVAQTKGSTAPAAPHGVHRQLLARGFPADSIIAEGSTGRDARADSDIAGQWFAGLQLRTRTCGGDCSHEPFVLKRVFDTRGCTHESGLYFAFCKTAYKPYDLAVQCVLVIAKHHLGTALLVSSDGREEHWDEARKLCQELVGYGSEFRLED